MTESKNEINKLASQLVLKLNDLGQTCTTVESCTGGGISSAITDIAGSSSVFEYGFVTYSNEAKSKLVGVKSETLEHFGAVSKQTVLEMAIGGLENGHADLAISVSGIAGPGGGSESKPVGTVWIAIASKVPNNSTGYTVFADHYCFEGNRFEVRKKSVEAALNMALGALSKKN